MALMPNIMRVLCFLGAALLLAACGMADTDQNYPERESRSADPNPTGERETVFGPGGLSIFGDKKSDKGGGGSGIGVNSFLWRASLDTLSFMPLNSADPFGGVIITDWYSAPNNPDERFKMTIYILDRRLRADGIKVAVFKQAKDAAREWLSAVVADDTSTQLEDAILVRARQLRLDTLQ
ncbi:MAG: DUF3576 domain-containing protein [Rhodospirillaceae bacterium]|jgi:hypothetical protein|nr:DUF3576 domain-containing protein [Rhodospirillaceae bacterium]MBT3494966.1 DUF3576 domain-containing protein [Rhodospirillaceae bacterium]MBT3780610.1 DUF3576 domain-containing protein [Rhodospirillaceae bacterium]MBT3975752.1 DUF3576 domain-containing protein [Rhodospirillaceae bacterium]MBT4168552.1 DUF3576 domain-containing protein [Rhodospirillaceae bacterium]